MLVYVVASRQEKRGDQENKATPLTRITPSESMGPHAHFRCMQPGRRRLFHDLFLPVPRLITEAPKIRRSVSCLGRGPHFRGWIFLAFPLLLPFCPPIFLSLSISLYSDPPLKARPGRSLVIG